MASFLLIAIISLAILACRVAGGDVPAIFVLGDSTADVGNNNYLPVGIDSRANYPHNGIDYPGGIPTGRFSNGHNGIDFLAKWLGFQESPPAFLSLKNETQMLNGVNFASGASGILDDTGKTIPFTQQVINFKKIAHIITKRMGKDVAPSILSNSLYLISTASNDLFAHYSSTAGSQNNTQNDQFITSLVLKFEDHLTALYRLGARKFGIIGASHIGCIPVMRAAEPSGRCSEQLNHLARLFNRAAKQRLCDLSSVLTGMKYSYANAYATMSLVQAYPNNFGFKEIRVACCGSGSFNGESACTLNATFCSNRNDYLYWDRFHPTEVTYKLVATSAFEGSRRFANPMNIKQLVEWGVRETKLVTE